jgi:porin
MKSYHRIMPVIGLAAALAAPLPSRADSGSNWFDWQTMTGDWGGLRTDLKNDGIDIVGHYVSETAGNPVGGAEQGGAYADEFGLGADISSKLLGWDGGTLHSLITERAGSDLSKDKIGNLLTVQEIYGDGQTVRITQLSYEQKLFGNTLDLEAGDINTETDFAASPKYFGAALWCNYQNNAICGTPIAAPVNSNGYVAYPASALGARVKVNLSPNIYIGTGAYEVNPTLYTSSNGFKLGTDGAEGVLTVIEAGWTADFGGMAGNYRVGGYYDNSGNRTAVGQATRFIPADSPVLSELPFANRAGRNGGWVLADQQIQADSAKTGTVLFGALEYGDHNTALITWYGEAGVLRQGTFVGRDGDSVALGFAIANLNDELLQFEKTHGTPGTSQEFVLELNYGVAVAPWLNMRPGVQYVWHPSGEDERRNALVLALKTSVTF